MNKTETSRGFYVEQARAEVLDNLRNGYVTLEDLEDAIESGDVHEYAHEYADGHEASVYHFHQDNLFASGVLADHEADADDMLFGSTQTGGEYVRQYIGTLVWLFLTDAYLEGLDRAVEQAKAEALNVR